MTIYTSLELSKHPLRSIMLFVNMFLTKRLLVVLLIAIYVLYEF